MSCMPNMTLTSLTAAVVPCKGEIIKNGLRFFFSKEEKIFYKMIYYTLYLS